MIKSNINLATPITPTLSSLFTQPYPIIPTLNSASLNAHLNLTTNLNVHSLECKYLICLFSLLGLIIRISLIDLALYILNNLILKRSSSDPKYKTYGHNEEWNEYCSNHPVPSLMNRIHLSARQSFAAVDSNNNRVWGLGGKGYGGCGKDWRGKGPLNKSKAEILDKAK